MEAVPSSASLPILARGGEASSSPHHHPRRRLLFLHPPHASNNTTLFLSLRIPPVGPVHRRDGGRTSWRRPASSSSSSSPAGGDGDGREEDEVERALGMDGSIPGSSQEFVRRVSSRAYDMRRHLMQTIDSVSYDVLESNPWRDDSKPVYVLTHRDNQLCTMKTRQNRSEVERELGLLFSKGGRRGSEGSNKSKNLRGGTTFQMLVEDIREGVLVFEDEHDATKYCDLLQGGGQGCEGIAEIEASSVFDICHRMRALAVLFRRGRTPPVPKSLEQNLKARKRSLLMEFITWPLVMAFN